MNFPAKTEITMLNDTKELIQEKILDGLKIKKDDIINIQKRGDDVLVHVTSDAFKLISPNLSKIVEIDTRGVMVTCQAPDDSPYDFFSRFFAPKCGIDEDPVTGSAHCALAPYWAQILKKNSMFARQTSSRGGDVHVEVQGSRVIILGSAVFTLRGHLL